MTTAEREIRRTLSRLRRSVERAERDLEAYRELLTARRLAGSLPDLTAAIEDAARLTIALEEHEDRLDILELDRLLARTSPEEPFGPRLVRD
jgi:hypothetical protein